MNQSKNLITYQLFQVLYTTYETVYSTKLQIAPTNLTQWAMVFVNGNSNSSIPNIPVFSVIQIR